IVSITPAMEPLPTTALLTTTAPSQTLATVQSIKPAELSPTLVQFQTPAPFLAPSQAQVLFLPSRLHKIKFNTLFSLSKRIIPSIIILEHILEQTALLQIHPFQYRNLLVPHMSNPSN